MMTLLGEVDATLLVKEETSAPCPVGTAITTRYFFEGELVRQDTTIEVTKAPSVGSSGWKGNHQ